MKQAEKGKILSLDVGTKKTGVAISDAERKMAFMRPEIFHTGNPELLNAIKEILLREHIGTILVGMPFSLSGNLAINKNHVLELIEDLKELKVEVKTMDERFTSKIASGRASANEEDDSQAALVLLETYLRIKA